MTRGRTDEPLTTDAEVRIRRSQRMATMIRTILEIRPEPPEDEDNLAQFISKCLAAHETDTLALLMDESRGREVVRRGNTEI